MINTIIMVFYRKYRPQTLIDLDNQKVAALIAKYVLRDEIPHAFLMTGPKGTGKTSTARILAKCVNCLIPTKGQSCGKCEVCVSIAEGRNLDILEVDAASNRGIDEIRALKETIKLSPTNLKYKVYIIDEVHMLTTEAFNALLKTLEEPPKHALFILATTEAHKIPETILSRCVRIDFHKASAEEIAHSLQRIITGEKLAIDPEALLLLSDAADGSFRDGAKLLEQVAAGNEHITKQRVKDSIGLTDTAQIYTFISHLRERKVKEALALVSELVIQGINMQTFFLMVLQQLEQELVSLVTGGESLWEKKALISSIRYLTQAFSEVKTAIIPSLPFELAIIELCEGGKVQPTSAHVTSNTPHTSVTAAIIDTSSASTITAKWTELLEGIKQHNHSIVGVLRSCRPLTLENNVLTIEAQYKFHAERLSDTRVQDTIALVVKEMLGLDVKINAVLKKR